MTVRPRFGALPSEQAVRAAVEKAIERILSGERSLAYSPSCGTSLLTAWLLQGLWIASVAIAVVFVTLPAKAVILYVCPIGAVVFLFEKQLGLLFQRLFTVSTDFTAARLVRVVSERRARGGRRFGVELEVTLD